MRTSSVKKVLGIILVTSRSFLPNISLSRYFLPNISSSDSSWRRTASLRLPLTSLVLILSNRTTLLSLNPNNERQLMTDINIDCL